VSIEHGPGVRDRGLLRLEDHSRVLPPAASPTF
jgi:hypothetical protein